MGQEARKGRPGPPSLRGAIGVAGVSKEPRGKRRRRGPGGELGCAGEGEGVEGSTPAWGGLHGPPGAQRPSGGRGGGGSRQPPAASWRRIGGTAAVPGLSSVPGLLLPLPQHSPRTHSPLPAPPPNPRAPTPAPPLGLLGTARAWAQRAPALVLGADRGVSLLSGPFPRAEPAVPLRNV